MSFFFFRLSSDYRQVLLLSAKGSRGKKEEGQLDDSTALWELAFGQQMGISSHKPPLNLSIYSQSPSYIGLQNKLCCWQGLSVTDLAAKRWITSTAV